MLHNVNYTKAQRRELKELKQRAYQLEMERELEILYRQFRRWKTSELSTWDLQEAIHGFHQGPSRKLYGRYTDVDDDIIVAWALKQGILSREDISDELYVVIEPVRAFYELQEDGQWES